MPQTLLWFDLALGTPGVLIDAGLEACGAFSPHLRLCTFPEHEKISFSCSTVGPPVNAGSWNFLFLSSS